MCKRFWLCLPFVFGLTTCFLNADSEMPSYSFDAPPGPQFDEAEKELQRKRAREVMFLVRERFDAGRDSVVLPPGDYRFENSSRNKRGRIYSIEFRNMKRPEEKPFRIVAAGVTFWFELPMDQTPTCHFPVGFVDCENLTIEGLTVDRDPKGCMEGRIAKIDPENNRMEIVANSGTSILTEFSDHTEQRLLPYNADGTFCAALYALQHRAPGRLKYRNIEPSDKPGYYWVNLHEKSELMKVNADPLWYETYGEAGTLQVGDGLSLIYTTTWVFTLERCTGLKFIGVNNYIAKGCVHAAYGGGGHLWKDYYSGPRPGTNQWTGGDGIMAGRSPKGSVFDGVTMRHTTDDPFNIHAYWGIVEQVEGRNIVQKNDKMPVEIGDKLNFYDKTTGKSLGTARVEAIDGRKLRLDGDACVFNGAVIDNPRCQEQNTVIRNCRITDSYQRILIQGAHGAVIRDNRFERLGSGLELHSNWFAENEGGFCRNIVVEDNFFIDVANAPDAATIRVGFDPLDKRSKTRSVENIMIRNNTFVNSGKHAILFSKVRRGEISGNRFVDVGRAHGLLGNSTSKEKSQAIRLDRCVEIEIDNE